MSDPEMTVEYWRDKCIEHMRWEYEAWKVARDNRQQLEAFKEQVNCQVGFVIRQLNMLEKEL